MTVKLNEQQVMNKDTLKIWNKFFRFASALLLFLTVNYRNPTFIIICGESWDVTTRKKHPLETL